MSNTTLFCSRFASRRVLAVLIVAGAALGACSPSGPDLTGLPAALELDLKVIAPSGPYDMPTELVLELTADGEMTQSGVFSLSTTPSPVWIASNLTTAKTWSLTMTVNTNGEGIPVTEDHLKLNDGKTLKYALTFTPRSPSDPNTPGKGTYNNAQSYYTTPKN